MGTPCKKIPVTKIAAAVAALVAVIVLILLFYYRKKASGGYVRVTLDDRDDGFGGGDDDFDDDPEAGLADRLPRNKKARQAAAAAARKKKSKAEGKQRKARAPADPSLAALEDFDMNDDDEIIVSIDTPSHVPAKSKRGKKPAGAKMRDIEMQEMNPTQDDAGDDNDNMAAGDSSNLIDL